MEFSNWLWGIWIAIALLSFGGLEAWAILSKDKEPKTLTEVLRSWLGIEPKRWWRGLGAAGLIAALSWIGLHLVWGF
ncbi:MAG: hypothetical protein ACRDXX_19950 [Stackebrandtia sp.]